MVVISRKVVKECLVGEDYMMDTRHFNVFFATYRAFATCSGVLEHLLNRYVTLESNATVTGRAKVIALQK